MWAFSLFYRLLLYLFILAVFQKNWSLLGALNAKLGTARSIHSTGIENLICFRLDLLSPYFLILDEWYVLYLYLCPCIYLSFSFGFLYVFTFFLKVSFPNLSCFDMKLGANSNFGCKREKRNTLARNLS